MYFHLLVCLVFFVALVCLFFHSIRMKLILTILFYYHWLWSAICFRPDFSVQNAANITSFQDFGNGCWKCRVIWLVRYLRCASFQHKVSVFEEVKLDTTEEKEKQQHLWVWLLHSVTVSCRKLHQLFSKCSELSHRLVHLTPDYARANWIVTKEAWLSNERRGEDAIVCIPQITVFSKSRLSDSTFMLQLISTDGSVQCSYS